MELVLCQACGNVLRSRVKNCAGCGSLVSKHFTPIASRFDNGNQALVIKSDNDSLVLERTINKVIYGGLSSSSSSSESSGGNFLYTEDEFSKAQSQLSFSPSSEQTPESNFDNSYSSNDFLSENINPESSAAYNDFEPKSPVSESDPVVPAPSNSNQFSSFNHTENPFLGNNSFNSTETNSTDSYSAGPSPSEVSQQNTFANQEANPNYSTAANHATGIASSENSYANSQSRQDNYVDSQQSTMILPTPASATPELVPQVSTQSSSQSMAPVPSLADSMQTANPALVAATAFAESKAPTLIAAPNNSAKTLFNAGVGGGDFFSATSSGPNPNNSLPPAAPSQSSGSGSGSSSNLSSSPSNTNSSSNMNSNSNSNFAAAFQGAQPSIVQNAIQAANSLKPQFERRVSSEVVAPHGNKKESSQSISDKTFDEFTKSKGKNTDTAKNKKFEDKDNNSKSASTKSKSTNLRQTSSKGYKPRNSKIEEDEDNEDDEIPGSKKSTKSAKSKKSKASKEETIEILGKSFTKKIIITAAILLVFLGFPALVLVSNLIALIGTVSGSIATSIGAAPLSCSGQWEFAFQNNDGSIGRGVINITQQGAGIEGWGVDSKAQFQIKGDVKSETLTFNKVYIQGGQAVGKPILYSGKIDMTNPNPQPGQPYMHVSGVWQFTRREGQGWRGQVVTRSGRWEAMLTQRQAEGAASQPPPGTTGSVSGNVQINKTLTSPGGAPGPDFFMKVALGIIAIGIGLAMLSLKFFGPSGLINIWAKKEYIPSQFKSQHFKMMGEMNKKLGPGSLPLGKRNDWGVHQFWRPRTLTYPPEMREQNPHILVLGAGAIGKTRLMASMICHDIESADRSVVVVDSDGGLSDLILNWVASHPRGKQLAKRMIIIDPTRDAETMCFNPLEFPKDGDLQNVASALVFGFKAIYTEPPGSQTQWNQQTANILRNSAILLMANGKTLTDLPVLLADNDFRDVLLEKVERMKHEKSEYTTLVEAWSNYKRLARTDQWINWIEPILNRVQPTLGDPRIRPILTKPNSQLDLQKIISDRKVLVVKIPHGQLDQNANLLGSLIVAGVKQAALSLSAHHSKKRRPCALYLDEFDSFIEKETFDAITSETRKFQIGLCGAAKTLQTLPEDYRNQIVINVGIMAIFALAKKDGDMLGPQMFRVDGRKIKQQTIQNFFNKVNTTPQLELISDEEKLNIDRVVGQERQTYFCYRVGSVAGVFNMKAPDFKDVDEKDINYDIIEQIYSNRVLEDEDETIAEEDEDDDD